MELRKQLPRLLSPAGPSARLLSSAIAAIAVLGLAIGGAGAADTFPSKPIRIVSPFSAGSPPDVFGRLVAQQVSAIIGQSIVIENRPGAGTTIATKAGSAADPDGYTLLQVNAALNYATVLYPNPGYDPIKSFAPIATMAAWSHVLVAHPSVAANSVMELIAYAKAHAGQVNIGAPLGQPPHLLAETLKIASAADFNVVPYRQTPQLNTDLLAGRIQVHFAAGEPTGTMIRQGKLKALAFTSASRDPAFPDVPTMAEAGLPQLTVGPSDWTGLLAPAGTPADVIEKLNAAVNQVLKSAETRATLAKLGWEAKITTPAEFGAFISADAAKWGPIARASGLKGE